MITNLSLFWRVRKICRLSPFMHKFHLHSFHSFHIKCQSFVEKERERKIITKETVNGMYLILKYYYHVGISILHEKILSYVFQTNFFI